MSQPSWRLNGATRKLRKKLPSFAFTRKAFETLNDKPVDKLIFDMRYNGGGNSFRNRICRTTRTSPQTTPASCGICGADAISSSRFERHGFQTADQCRFAGEETAGKPNHFGRSAASFQKAFGQLFKQHLTSEKRSRPSNPTCRSMSFADFKEESTPFSNG